MAQTPVGEISQPNTSAALRETGDNGRGVSPSRLPEGCDQHCEEVDGDQFEGISDEKLKKQLTTVTDEKEIKRIKR
jgi:hypothetical protein